MPDSAGPPGPPQRPSGLFPRRFADDDDRCASHSPTPSPPPEPAAPAPEAVQSPANRLPQAHSRSPLSWPPSSAAAAPDAPVNDTPASSSCQPRLTPTRHQQAASRPVLSESHHHYQARPQQQPHPRRGRRPSSASSSSSATVVSAYSPPPTRRLDYRYMATPAPNGLFQEYEPTSDDELPSYRSSRHHNNPSDARNWQQRRPLIDSVTNEWRKHVNHDDDSDEEDFFYGDKQTWYNPALATFIAAQRIPRRIQRTFVTVVAVAAGLWISYTWFLGPWWAEQSKLSDALVGAQKYGAFGANARPAFTDMIQVKTLDPSLLPSSSADRQRLVVVGDVHGCKSELVELLHKVNFHPASDHLILTGDMIAKGPDSPGVIDFVRDLHASCVRGNHEDRILLSRKAMRVAEADMGKNKLLSEDEARNAGANKDKKLAMQFSRKQIDWLEECPVTLRVGEIKGMGEVAVAHAGLVPGVDLERQDPYQVMNMRSIDLDTKVPSEDRDGTSWSKYWNYFQKFMPQEKRSTVIYGHDAKRGLNIKKYTKGLDSGCVVGGKLTALVIEADPRGGPAKQKMVSVKCAEYHKKDESSEKR